MIVLSLAQCSCKVFLPGQRGDSRRVTSALQKWDILMKILTEPDTIAECCKENLHNITVTVQ